jgi:ribosomal protein S18 acetylase RimI-like enzyme
MVEIRKLQDESAIDDLLSVIQQSFMTVARDFHLTRNNAPTNPAFLTMDMLSESIKKGLDFYLAFDNDTLCGCVGVQPGKKEGEFYIERLAVLPYYRHMKLGKKLLDTAIEEIINRNGKIISIGIIDENKKLKQWYLNHGFVEKGTKRFGHLPFTVCFLEMDL